MRTLLFLVAGLALGAVIVVGGRAVGHTRATALTVFGVLWVAVAAWNLWEGVAHAGYTVREELPIFLVIAVLPIGLVAMLSRRLG
jgi:uncharacterized membrane protein YwaF